MKKRRPTTWSERDIIAFIDNDQIPLCEGKVWLGIESIEGKTKRDRLKSTWDRTIKNGQSV